MESPNLHTDPVFERIDDLHAKVKYKHWEVIFSREGGSLHVEADHSHVPEEDLGVIWNKAREGNWNGR